MALSIRPNVSDIEVAVCWVSKMLWHYEHVCFSGPVDCECVYPRPTFAAGLVADDPYCLPFGEEVIRRDDLKSGYFLLIGLVFGVLHALVSASFR